MLRAVNTLYNRRRRARVRQYERLANLEPNRDRIDGTVFALAGSIYVQNTTERVWVHEWGIQSSALQAYKPPYIQVWNGAGVTLMRNPKAPDQFEIIKVHVNPYPPQAVPSGSSNIRAVVDNHGTNHQWPTEAAKGRDAFNIYPPAIAMLKSEAGNGNLTVTVGPLYYGVGVERKFFAGGNIDLTSHIPATPGDYVRVLVYLNTTTNALGSVAGTTDTVDWPPFPDAPADVISSAFYTLENGQTELDQLSDYVDARRFLTETGGGGVETFLDLTDTPDAYTGEAGNIVAVNGTEDGLEFIAPGGGVTGPVSSTDNALARWNGAGGDTLQDSAIIQADDGTIDTSVSTALTSAVTPAAKFHHRTSGTPAAGFGASLEFYADAASEDQLLGSIGFSWVDTGTYRRSRFVLIGAYNTYNNVLAVITVPYGTSNLVGDARGNGSVDLQSFRTADTQVVSGNYSGALAGMMNTVSGDYSGVIGGTANTVSGNGSVILGGASNLASGDGSAVIGGSGSQAQHFHGVVLSGYKTWTHNNAEVVAGHANTTPATSDIYACHIHIPLNRKITTHTDTTWYDLYVNATTKPSVGAAGRAGTYLAIVTGTDENENTWSYYLWFSITYPSAGSLAINASSVTALYEFDAAYEVQVVASSPSFSIQVRRNGGTDYAIWWTATIMGVTGAWWTT